MKRLDMDKINAYLNSPKGKKTVLLYGAGAVLAVVLLVVFFEKLDSFIPSETKLSNENRNYKKTQLAYAETLKKYEAVIETEKRFAELKKRAWLPGRDGDVETELRRQIRDAALSCDIRINSIGSVRKKAVNNQVYFAELDLDNSGTMENLTKFWRLVYEHPVEIAWKRIDLRNEFFRGNQQSSNTAQMMKCNGTLRVMVFEDKKETKK